ncbi:MAG: hypothetical protein UY85_C0034G0001, partial [Candidatus Peribacteria bacterium GW2011_GWB1_54_5]
MKNFSFKTVGVCLLLVAIGVLALAVCAGAETLSG